MASSKVLVSLLLDKKEKKAEDSIKNHCIFFLKKVVSLDNFYSLCVRVQARVAGWLR